METPVAVPRRPRLTDLDAAKGLGIFLVVVGHITAREVPAGNDWFQSLHDCIYKFHMPFFMFISGAIMFYSYTPVVTVREYWQFCRKRFWRLMPAYGLFAAVIVAGKIFAQRFVYVDNLPAGLLSGLAEVVVRPATSSASSLWYVYVLFAYYLLAPVVLALCRGRLGILVAAGAVIHFLPTTDLFGLDKIMEYALVFSLGAFCVRHYDRYTALVDRFVWVWFAIFGAALVSLSYWQVPKVTMGLLSIPALHGLCRQPVVRTAGVLRRLSEFTFPIYLMNTIFIGLTKGLVLKLVTWDGPNFLWIAPLLVVSGVLGPIVVKAKLFRLVPPIDRITN